MPGLHILPERTTAGSRQNVRHPELLHGANVGAIIDLGGIQAMVATVAERGFFGFLGFCRMSDSLIE